MAVNLNLIIRQIKLSANFRDQILYSVPTFRRCAFFVFGTMALFFRICLFACCSQSRRPHRVRSGNQFGATSSFGDTINLTRQTPFARRFLYIFFLSLVSVKFSPSSLGLCPTFFACRSVDVWHLARDTQ